MNYIRNITFFFVLFRKANVNTKQQGRELVGTELLLWKHLGEPGRFISVPSVEVSVARVWGSKAAEHWYLQVVLLNNLAEEYSTFLLCLFNDPMWPVPGGFWKEEFDPKLQKTTCTMNNSALHFFKTTGLQFPSYCLACPWLLDQHRAKSTLHLNAHHKSSARFCSSPKVSTKLLLNHFHVFESLLKRGTVSVG